MIRLYLENKLNRYVSSVRKGVWLIVLPAFFTTIFYLLNNFTDVVIKEKRSRMIDYETKFASLRNELPKHANVNFVSDQDDLKSFFAVRYVLVPARLSRGLQPQHDYLIVQSPDLTKLPHFKGFDLKKDYGNGVALFSRSYD